MVDFDLSDSMRCVYSLSHRLSRLDSFSDKGSHKELRKSVDTLPEIKEKLAS